MEPEVIREGGARVPDESVITATVQITWQETSCLQQNADLLIPPIRSHRGRIRPWRPFLQIPTLYLVVAVVAWMGVASLSFFAREAIFSAIGIKAGDWQWPWDTGEKRWQQDRRGGGRRGTAPRSSGDITSEATRELLETKVDEDYNTFVEVGGTARLNNDQDVLEAAFEEDFYNFFLEDSSSYPSSVPSASPNTEPTFTPTREPTTPGTRPTSTPTYNPTREPTIPVDGPTVPPTFNPTMFPTNEPDDFDCSRILDENGLVRYYWDFPFQDSDGNMNLRSRLTYFGMGWVGWGIPLASTPPDGFLATGFVEGTDVVIGLSDLPRSRTNPGRYSIDGPSLADVNLLPDRAQTLREASVRQTRRRSDMTFTYVMNGAMSNPVNITGENTIVWAYGFSNILGHNGDELGSHRDRDSYLIDFGVCSETAAPSPLPPPPPPPPPPSPEIEESVSPSTSFVPSRTPSLMPSVSAKPSRSLRPSSLFLPSAFPSVSSAPSSKPSSVPSSEPSSAPSNVPSNAPTRSYDHEIIVDEKNLVRFAWDTPIDSGNGVTVLSARLSYLGRGWVGWGTPKVEDSDSSSFTKRLLQVSEGFIINSVAVIGLPDEPIGRQNPGLYSVQNITASGIVLLPTAEQLLQTASIKQSGNATVMTFSKVLNLTTTHPVSIAGDNVFTYTFGLNNTIESLEGWRTFRVDLTDPTKSTPRPSLSPRPSESMVPSQSPRPSQKYQPSAAPSKSTSPSANPSDSPSQKPSRAPSAGPSTSASPSQKYQPSAAPSKSARPSANPSDSPSQKPSRAPSASPSSGPSKSPTSK